MSVVSALSDRIVMWRTLLCDDFGYSEAAPSRPRWSANELVIVAARPEFPPIEPVRFEIRETWLPGADPDGLQLQSHGCHLAVSSWHAQILEASGDLGAERLDVDRRKPPEEMIHRHPFGASNQVREPAVPLKHPEAWVVHVEEIIATHYGY